MEGSFAKELYSDSLQLPKVELDPTPAATGRHEGDFQDEDAFYGSDEELDKPSHLEREWERRRYQFHTMGYRDGIMAGKEASAQEGFNIGFKQSVLVGYEWGNCRGVTSAIACLPDGLREKLINTQEKRDKFQVLYKSMHSFSTTDALKLFHDDIMTKKALERSVDAEATSDTECLQNQSSESSLGNIVDKLQSLLLESPTIDSHLSVK